MIPKNISKNHILKAIDEINMKGVPPGRDSTKFCLAHDGHLYPPKYIISLANKYANCQLLDSTGFNGGKESNGFLENLGFNIITLSRKDKEHVESSPRIKKPPQSKNRHNERCPECKETIYKLLAKIYGKVEKAPKFRIGTKPEAFRGTQYYNELKEIYSALQNHRGFKDFVRSKTLPNCDYFVPDPGMIVEFDESQHFTAARKVALQHYPAKLKWGFDRRSWLERCIKLNRKDNDPPYRDEQRAWYDTLRDFLPKKLNLYPTVRLFSKDAVWCALKAEKSADISKFKSILGLKGLEPKKTQKNPKIPQGNVLHEEYTNFQVDKYVDENPFLGRIIIASDWDAKVETAKKVLRKVCLKWPANKKVRFLITCGAFLTFNWPRSISRKEVGDNKNPEPEVLRALKEKAEKQCKFLLDKKLRQKLCKHAEYITIGIDSHKQKISLSSVPIRVLHIELVALINLRNNKYYWVGKSYPTSGQEKGLVRWVNLADHFVDINNIGNVMILGCHDLNIFSRRGRKTTNAEWRQNVRSKFYELTKNNKPRIVLHHPHTTDSSKTWTAAWNELNNAAPKLTNFASAGRYYNAENPGEERTELPKVRIKTKKGSTLDFVVRPKV